MGELGLLQGESVNWQFTYTDQEGEAIDLTHYVVYIMAVEEFGTKRVLFKYDSVTNPDIVSTDPMVVGMTNVVIPDTTGFKAGKYIVEMAYRNTIAGLVSKPDHVRLTIERGLI